MNSKCTRIHFSWPMNSNQSSSLFLANKRRLNEFPFLGQWTGDWTRSLFLSDAQWLNMLTYLGQWMVIERIYSSWSMNGNCTRSFFLASEQGLNSFNFFCDFVQVWLESWLKTAVLCPPGENRAGISQYQRDNPQKSKANAEKQIKHSFLFHCWHLRFFSTVSATGFQVTKNVRLLSSWLPACSGSWLSMLMPHI